MRESGDRRVSLAVGGEQERGWGKMSWSQSNCAVHCREQGAAVTTTPSPSRTVTRANVTKWAITLQINHRKRNKASLCQGRRGKPKKKGGGKGVAWKERRREQRKERTNKQTKQKSTACRLMDRHKPLLCFVTCFDMGE